MEKGLRDCCRSIRIGKILIQSETATSKPQVTCIFGLKISKKSQEIHNSMILLYFIGILCKIPFRC